jgi:hypothetical protein
MTRPDEEPGARRSTLTAPSAPAFLPMVQGFVREDGFASAELGRLDLLMKEAATNVSQGAFGGDENGGFDVICERVPAGIQIAVHDEGLPYEPSLTPDYDPGADLESQAGAGLGGFLMDLSTPGTGRVATALDYDAVQVEAAATRALLTAIHAADRHEQP